MIIGLKVLGSCSPYPNNSHNCPGFLVVSDETRILLDCGNGILRLIHFPEDLTDLSVIITHMHNDHFGDLGALQYASYTHHNLGLINEKITVYLPSASNDLKTKTIINEPFSYAEYKYISDCDTIQIKDVSISFLKTSHSENSYAIKIKDSISFTIVYTSDISYRDKEQIVQFAKNAHILICDSSFIKEHGFPEISSHLTAEQAATIAEEANALMLILNHFWPEEDRNKYLDEAKKIFNNTFLAEEKDIYTL